MAKYDVLKQAVLTGDEATAMAEVKKALAGKADPGDVLNNGLIAGMEVVGKKFRAGEMFLPEVLLSAEVMHKGIDILNPLLSKAGRKGIATVVIGTVEGDIHDIGKKIVALLLEGNGFNVIDLGVDVKGEKFVEAIENVERLLALEADAGPFHNMQGAEVYLLDLFVGENAELGTAILDIVGTHQTKPPYILFFGCQQFLHQFNAGAGLNRITISAD